MKLGVFIMLPPPSVCKSVISLCGASTLILCGEDAAKPISFVKNYDGSGAYNEKYPILIEATDILDERLKGVNKPTGIVR